MTVDTVLVGDDADLLLLPCTRADISPISNILTPRAKGKYQRCPKLLGNNNDNNNNNNDNNDNDNDDNDDDNNDYDSTIIVLVLVLIS